MSHSKQLIALLFFILLSPFGFAEEGMFPFNRLPKQELLNEYGFELTNEWAEHVQKSSTRFPGGSGSFSSPHGLILTNHHVARGGIEQVSSEDNDYIKDGFYAETLADEVRIPNYEIRVLQEIVDVTEDVFASVTPEMNAAEALDARKAAIAEIEASSKVNTGLESNVESFFGGAVYNLFLYKTYEDVRLVWAPELSAASFGGEPDNFQFPRFNLDASLVRVYEEGQPASNTNWLKWNEQGSSENDLVFVSGHPGGTDRLNTLEDFAFQRDFYIPYAMGILGHWRAGLEAFMERGEEQKRQAAGEHFGIVNSLQVYQGRERFFAQGEVFKKKAAEQSAMIERAEESQNERYIQALNDIKNAKETYKELLWPYKLVAQGQGLAFWTRYFVYARSLVRLPAEDAKPNAERLPEFQEANRQALMRGLQTEAPIYPELEEAKLALGLELLSEKLGGEHPIVKVALADQTPETRAAELIQGSKLNDLAFRQALIDGGAKAIADSNDPIIKLVRVIDDEARQLRKDYEDSIVAVEEKSYEVIAQELFALDPNRYPDANFTLRLSYGTVKPYTENGWGFSPKGSEIAPYTTMGGTFERQEEKESVEPWILPESWMKAEEIIDPEVEYNFCSTNDIIGGNSGSPVIDRNGELVGLIFDGNRQSLGANYSYDDEVSRAVSVDVRAIIHSLEVIYGADRILNEIRTSEL